MHPYKRKRQLAWMDDPTLARAWRDFALEAVLRQDELTGGLPPAYAEEYELLKAEFARRGMQLALF